MWPNWAPIFCSSSGESERRARWATYFTSISTILVLIKFVFNERLDLREGLGRIVAVSVNGQFASRAGGEHHQTHNALAIDFLTVLLDKNIAPKAIGYFDKGGGRPCMNAQFICHQKVLCHYGTNIS